MALPDGYLNLQVGGNIGLMEDERLGNIYTPIKFNLSGLSDGQLLKFTAATSSFDAVNQGGSSGQFTVYSALISQAGTAAPTEAVKYTDTITGLVWSRFSTGVYQLVKNGAILANKIFFSITINRTITEFAAGVYMSVNRSDNNTLIVSTSIGNGTGGQTATDGILSNTPFELRIYP